MSLFLPLAGVTWGAMPQMVTIIYKKYVQTALNYEGELQYCVQGPRQSTK
jgi:hypothetical protein